MLCSNLLIIVFMIIEFFDIYSFLIFVMKVFLDKVRSFFNFDLFLLDFFSISNSFVFFDDFKFYCLLE